MRFDYTHGLEAKYMVSVYGDTVCDHYYFHYYNAAKKMFNNIVADCGGGFYGYTISICDIKKDVRKDFARIRGMCE